MIDRAGAMDNLLVFPSRNLARVTLFMLALVAVTTAGYMEAGWNFQDSLYMVTLTVFTVGYGEVHPIDTAYLHALTIMTMLLGCTGMIFFTGAAGAAVHLESAATNPRRQARAYRGR